MLSNRYNLGITVVLLVGALSALTHSTYTFVAALDLHRSLGTSVLVGLSIVLTMTFVSVWCLSSKRE